MHRFLLIFLAFLLLMAIIMLWVNAWGLTFEQAMAISFDPEVAKLLYYDQLGKLGLNQRWFGMNGPWVLMWASLSTAFLLATWVAIIFRKRQ